ncbi:MAG: DUF3786 domain-containing protein [Desulfobacterales bacterium]|jgi:hypothetical protein
MPKIHTTMDVFKLLEKSNCRQCNEPTCLAFAAAVFKGQRRIEECPRLDPETAAAYGGSPERGPTMAQAAAEAIEHLQAEVAKVDLARVAPRLGGTYADGRLTLRILGKTFGVDDRGRFITDIHVHEWIAGPVLQYILAGKGCSVSGNWAPMRELAGGQDWYRLFSQRCEKPLKAVADRYTDLFADMVHLFNGRRAGQHFDADISVVLHPLPLVPLLVCYWKPEEGMASDLHLFFDDGGARNLDIGSLYTLGAGLTLMFEKIAQRHG